ncbi:MAG: hypothetical protein H7A52_14665 [Akkermansiaceae bacterium]|nr:hypothetical protein [Akkermansiaceae bacterium]
MFGSFDGPAFDDLDPDNKKSVVSTVADGVVAMWMQCFDLMGNPIPWSSKAPKHPKNDLVFNSSALFKMATSEPFKDGKTFTYLPDSDHSVKGNRLPAAIEVTVVMTIRDTCRTGGGLEAFKKENRPLSGGDVKSLGNWGRFPSILVKLGGGRQAVRVLVNGRFVVELAFGGNNLAPVPRWLRLCDLDPLLAAPETAATHDERVAVLEFIDELHPDRDRRYFRPVDEKAPTEKPTETPGTEAPGLPTPPEPPKKVAD